MHSIYTSDMLVGAVEMVTCFFTVVVAFLSYLLTWRA
jgi:hypothetical protein